MIIYIIRHGDNESLGNYLPGQKPGVHLNENGLKQAEGIAHSLQSLGISAIVSSPLERTIETAQPLADCLNLSISIDAGFIEMDTGEFTGVRFDELKKSKLWKQIRRSPEKTGFPGGERFEDAKSRVWNSVQKLHQTHPAGSVIAIFTHSDCIKMILTNALQLPLAYFPRFVIDPASLTILGFRKETTWLGGMNLHLPYALPPLHPQNLAT